MSHPRTLLLCNRQAFREIDAARFRRVDANLGQRIIDRIGGGVEDRAHCALDEDQIAVGAGAFATAHITSARLKRSTSSSTTTTHLQYVSVPKVAMIACCGWPAAVFLI